MADLSASGLYDSGNGLSIDEINWAKDTIEDVSSSDDGSSGVFFLKMRCAHGTGVILLKGSQEPAREVFMARVARSMNVSTPKIQVISHTMQLYQLIKKRTWEAVKGPMRRRVEKALMKPQYLIMEFVAGKSLYSFQPNDHLQLFSAGSETGAKVFHSLAKIIALDVIANYFDRVPLLWDNYGNYGNFIIQDSGQCVAIDNGMRPIPVEIAGRPNMQHGRYFEKVDALLDAISNRPNVECQQMETMRSKMRQATGCALTRTDGIYLQEKLKDALQKIAGSLTREFLAAERDAVVAMVPVDWENVWKTDCDRISIEWIMNIIELINKVLK